jgi:hypothetical protein
MVVTSGLIGITKPSGQFAVGQIETFRVSNTPLPSGEVFNLKITDNVTSQMVCDKKLRT